MIFKSAGMQENLPLLGPFQKLSQLPVNVLHVVVIPLQNDLYPL
jgi:hypothetical protein